MKKLVILYFIFLFLLIGCQSEFNVIISKEPGMISGIVVPTDVIATVSLYQGGLVKETTTDNDGVFVIKDVDPGTYRLIVRADNYGSVEINQIKVSDSEGYDIGIIELIPIPNPLVYVYPDNGTASYSIYSSYLRFTFDEYMLPESVRDALTIVPEVEITEYVYPTETYGNSRYSYTFFAEFKHGIEYSYTLDTTAISSFGNALEFAYNGTFTMEKFEVISIDDNREYSSNISIVFNGYVPEDNLDKVSFYPGTALLRDYSYRYSSSRSTRYIYQTIFSFVPVTSWITDTTYQMIISGDISENNGATLGKDTSYTFTTEPIEITYTYPHNDQYYIGLLPDILVRFNNFIDESTIEEALTVSPAAVYEIYSYRNNNYSYFYLNVTTGLQSKTEYIVSISTALTDIYGKHLKEPYSFRFVTQ